MAPSTTIEDEALKESIYRTQVQSLLQKHAPTFLSDPPSQESSQQYKSEQALVDKIVANERTALAYGVALSGVVFASVRFGPRWLAVRIGGKDKERAMREAEEEARKAGTAWIQKGLCEC
jgi:hypothetical protein